MTDVNSSPAQQEMSRVECVIAVLAVRDLQASLRFYCDVLQFATEWGGDRPTDKLASVGRDGCSIMLRQEGQSGSTVWIGVDDVESVYQRCLANHVEITQAPVSRPWAREMFARDPDGNVLWFGSDPEQEPT